ncbi:MAG: endo-1,4-beta-xylanase [Defluviitaleaceae bacterium]|nr:endo-1,4-beta-xylanase [Defluviitaleaceae bacterium]
MKKLFFLFFLLSFAACGRGNSDENDNDEAVTGGRTRAEALRVHEALGDVSITAVADEGNLVRVTIFNGSEYWLTTGVGFSVEYYEAGYWWFMPSDTEFVDIGIPILPGDTEEFTKNPYVVAGILPPGIYRIRKGVFRDIDAPVTGDDIHELTAEFIVTPGGDFETAETLVLDSPTGEIFWEEDEEAEPQGTVLFNIGFNEDCRAAYGGFISGGGQVLAEWVDDFGREDNTSVRLTNTTGNYASGAGNYLRFDLPQSLPEGGLFEISWWVYVPREGNVEKTTIPGGGLNINSSFGSPAHQPTNDTDLTRRTTFGTWTRTVTEFRLDHTVGNANHLIFRFRVNEPERTPTIWYVDDILITQLDMREAVTPEWDLTLPSLAEVFAAYFYFGNIIEPPIIRDNPFGTIEMFLHHYNSVTAENAMKPDAVSGGGLQATRPASLNLAGAEAVVSFAEENNLQMIGHTLLWHEQSAPWFHTCAETGEPLSRAEAMENMRWFIENYAGHFEGRVHAWDVTNEVFTGGGGANNSAHGPEGSPVFPVGDWRRALRNYVPWYHAFANGADFDAGESGSDYVYYAFVFTRRYAPSAILIYNDFNEHYFHKRNAMANMTEALNERWANDAVNNPAFGNPAHPDYGRLLVEAIGMQAHYSHNTNFQDVYAALERFSQTGARIHITELDLNFPSQLDEPFVLTDAQLQRQADLFAQLFTWYVEFADYIERVTIWGRDDGTNWRGPAGATLFDNVYRAKPAFFSVVEAAGSSFIN